MKRRTILTGLGLSTLAASLDNGVLTLSDVHDATLFFTDRPERITGHEPTEDFSNTNVTVTINAPTSP